MNSINTAKEKNYINLFLLVKNILENIINNISVIMTDCFYHNYHNEENYYSNVYKNSYTVNNYLYDCCFKQGVTESIRCLICVIQKAICYYFNIENISNKEDSFNVIRNHWDENKNSYHTFVSFFDTASRIETAYNLYLARKHNQEHKRDKILNTILDWFFELNCFLKWFIGLGYIPF